MTKGTRLEPMVWWIYSVCAVTALFAAVYVTGQQQYRTGLDDPQIQMAEDGALVLAKRGVPADVVPHGPVFDAGASLAPWVAVFDENGLPLESTASIGNDALRLPQGVFDVSTWSKAPMYTQNGMQETRFTWQPNQQVRQAVVLVKTSNGGYVAAGRNMREVEQRIEHEGEILFALWLCTVGGLLVAVYLRQWLLRTT